MKTKNKINWTNTLFLTICPIVGVVGTVLLAIYSSITWPTWVLLAAYLYVTGLAITVGYHRLFSHKTYQANAVVRFILLMFGAANFEGSVLEWSTDHRRHHRYADTKDDPYNINQGFWYAHIGWLLRLDTSKRDFSNVADLEADPLCRFQHKYVVSLGILMGFVVPTAIAWCWGAPLAGLIVVGALRIALNHHFTFFINSLCHTFGKRTYTEEQTARDHWIAAIFTYGEGYHNYHHKFPIDYRNGVRLFHYDPAKWVIWLLSKLGWAHNLKRVSSQRIARYILQEQKLEERTKETGAHAIVVQSKEQIIKLVERLEALEKEYAEMLKAASAKSTIKHCRSQLRQLRRELTRSLSSWSKLARQYA